MRRRRQKFSRHTIQFMCKLIFFLFLPLFSSQGQFSEEQILDNNENSPLFEEFLQLLGDKVRLRGFDKYKGGLGECVCIVYADSLTRVLKSARFGGIVIVNKRSGIFHSREKRRARESGCVEADVLINFKFSLFSCMLILSLRHRSRFNRTL